jgi:hypothetical protein
LLSFIVTTARSERQQPATAPAGQRHGNQNCYWLNDESQYVREADALYSAESGFCQHVSHVLRPVSSFSTAPAVTGVLCPDVPGGSLLIAGLCCAFTG